MIESAKDYLFLAYTMYARARRALNPDFQPYLYAEIGRPVTFAAQTLAFAASFPFFLCAFGVRANKAKHWNKIPASFLPSSKKPVPLAALPLFILIAHLNNRLIHDGALHDLFLRLRARLLPSPSEPIERLLSQVEELARCLAAGVIVVPLEVLLCTMLSSHAGLVSSASTVWNEKGLGGFFSGFGWFVLAQYLTV